MKKEDLYFTDFIDGLLMLLSTAVPFTLTIKNYFDVVPSIESRLALLISSWVLFFFYVVKISKWVFPMQLVESGVALILLVLSIVFTLISFSRNDRSWLDTWSVISYAVSVVPIAVEMITALILVDLPEKRDFRKSRRAREEVENRRQLTDAKDESHPTVGDV